MKRVHCLFLILGALGGIVAQIAMGATVAVEIPTAPAPSTQPILLGSNRAPDGSEIGIDGTSLLLNGRRWMPVMGEFHYTRYPKAEWRDELLKMKAGGIDIVATYVFWIHHEEVEGKWDWSGNKSLHDFVALVNELGMKTLVRCGPWSHGECRNGGFPDWLLDKGGRLRSEDPLFMEQTRELYQQIAAQLKGQLWKDGGAVIGIQHDNEYGGPASYLLALKKIAQDAGLDVPLYTRTGWPRLSSPMPYPQILPLYGSYGDGFWDRSLAPMPGNFWQAFIFSPERLDTATNGDRFARRPGPDQSAATPYPYLTCELWGGLEPAYHRRIRVSPTDVLAVPLVKLGSGGQMLGYYMYHGGTNPDGQLSTMMESQNTRMTNSNDLPVKSYDFNAPLGEFGQIRPQYGLLRRLHLFMHDFGEELTTMPAYFPAGRPSGRSDTDFLRFSVRSDGKSGFIFVSNYQRLTPMPAKPQTQFDLRLPSGVLQVPLTPTTIPADSSFFWPFNMQIGGSTLIYATAQPMCQVDDGQTRYTFFAQTKGVPAEFLIDPNGAAVEAPAGTLDQQDSRILIKNVHPGTGPAIRLRGSDGKQQVIVLLDEAMSVGALKAHFAGADRVLMSQAGLVVDGDTLRLQSTDPADLAVEILPSPTSMQVGNGNDLGTQDGLFRRFSAPAPSRPAITVTVEQTKQAGPARRISMGSAHVAAQPVDADFDAAAAWTIKLPPDANQSRKLILRANYVGDVARYYLDGKLLTDNFYTGGPFDIGLDRFGPDVYSKGLTLKILPLRKDAPIYLEQEAKPDFGDQDSIVKLNGIEVLEECDAQFKAN
ncbi:MAG: beta-galactosidase [Tepidisphaeraceae bacterium]